MKRLLLMVAFFSPLTLSVAGYACGHSLDFRR